MRDGLSNTSHGELMPKAKPRESMDEIANTTLQNLLQANDVIDNINGVLFGLGDTSECERQDTGSIEDCLLTLRDVASRIETNLRNILYKLK